MKLCGRRKEIASRLVAGSILMLGFATAEPSGAAEYRVSIAAGDVRRAAVEATVLPDGGVVAFHDEGNQGLAHGWSSFLEALSIRDADGRPLAAVYEAPSRWRLPRWSGGPVELTYTLHLQHDRLPLAFGDNGAAFARHGVVMWSGRALFLVGADEGSTRVELDVPSTWQVATPWQETGPDSRAFRVAGRSELVNSAWLGGVMTRERLRQGDAEVDVALAGDLAFAQRETLIALVREALDGFAREIGDAPRERLLLIAVDASYWGGEVMGRTISLSLDEDLGSVVAFPLPVLELLSHLVTHEVFHLWGTRMLAGGVGEANGELQWFQEGFTADYLAVLSQLGSGRLTGDQLLEILGRNLEIYRATSAAGASLVEAGADKDRLGGLVYQGAMLAALAFDLELRGERGDATDLPVFVRHLYSEFGDDEAAVARLSLEDLYEEASSVLGVEAAARLASLAESEGPLPVQQAFERLGILEEETAEGLRLRRVAAPSAEQERLWRALVPPTGLGIRQPG